MHRLQNGNISNLEGRKTSVPLPLPTGRILYLKRYSLQIQKNGERDLVVWTRNWIQKCSGWAVRGEKPLPRGPECLPRGRCSPAMGGSPGNLQNHLDQNYIKLSHTKDKRKHNQSALFEAVSKDCKYISKVWKLIWELYECFLQGFPFEKYK